MASSNDSPPAVIFLSDLLKVSTNLSARPFDCGWKGAVIRWTIAFFSQYDSKAPLVNCVPLCQCFRNPESGENTAKHAYGCCGGDFLGSYHLGPLAEAVHQD